MTLWRPADFVRYIVLISLFIFLVSSIAVMLSMFYGSKVIANDLENLSSIMKQISNITEDYTIVKQLDSSVASLVSNTEKFTFIRAFFYGMILASTIFGGLAFYYFYKMRKFLANLMSQTKR